MRPKINREFYTYNKKRHFKGKGIYNYIPNIEEESKIVENKKIDKIDKNAMDIVNDIVKKDATDKLINKLKNGINFGKGFSYIS